MKFALVLLLATISFKLDVGQMDILKCPCSTNGTLINYNMYSQNIAQFFSPSFPQNLIVNNSIMTSCQAKFYTVNDQQIWMAIYNGMINSFQISDDYNDDLNWPDFFDSNDEFVSFSSSFTSLTFKLNTEISIGTDWTAFEGVVIAYDWTTQCPFTGQSIDFTDVQNTLIIPVASYFDDKWYITKCHWSFDTYFGQYLKIVMQKLVLNDNVTLELQRNGKLIKRFYYNISHPEVYYFTSNGMPFTLFYNDTNPSSAGTFFKALVSGVTFPTSIATSQCLESAYDGNIQKISNLNYDIGYKGNQNCEHEIITNENEEYLMDVSVFHIEKNVDILSMMVGNQKYTLTESSQFQLTQFANNSIISFAADPSVQQVGFEITLKTLDCACTDSDIIIPCEFGIQLTPLEDQRAYCDGMRCNYTISQNSSCIENGFHLHLEASFRNNTDFMNLYINGSLQESYKNDVDLLRHFSSDTEVVLEFLSGTSDTVVKNRNAYWIITLESEQIPEINVTMLSEEMSYKVFKVKDLPNNEVITICTPKKKNQLELIVAATSYAKKNLKNYALYDGKTLDNFIGSLESIVDLGRISFSSSCFTLYKSYPHNIGYEDCVILFRMQNAKSRNCQFDENVKLLSYESETFDNLATSNGSCEMIILIPDVPDSVQINSMRGDKNNIFVLKAASNQNIFARINSSEFSQWINFTLYTPALSIEIPPSAYFRIEAMRSILSDVDVVTNPQKGIIVSPNFGGIFGYSISVYHIHSSALLSNQYITAEFLLQSKHGAEDLKIKNNFYNNNQSLTIPGEIISMNGTKFYLYPEAATSNDDSFLIEYSLTINDAVTTTSTTTSTSTTTTSATTSPTATTTTTSIPTTTTTPSTTIVSTTIPSTITSPTTTTAMGYKSNHGTSNLMLSLWLHFMTICLVRFGLKFGN